MAARNLLRLVVAVTLSAFSVSGYSQDLPNIIVIMPDDLGWGDVGYNGSEIRTPAIDRLADEGLVLTRYYTHPTCSPTRTAFYSGRHPLSLGMTVPLPPWVDEGLPLGEKLLPQYLKEAGYATWLIGKWHLGHAFFDQHPQSRGYDHFYGTLGPELNYFTHALNRTPDWERNGQALIEEGYVTHLLRDEAVRLLDDYDADAPFFMHFAPTAPHAPLQAPQETVDAYASIEDRNRRRLAAMVTELDAAVGDIVDAVRRREDADNTLILFISDNGGDIPAGASSGPLRGGKSTPYDGGIRVPAIAWWPARLGAGSVDEFISVYDWLPTLTSLAGMAPEAEVPGVDAWPALTGRQLSRSQPIVLSVAMPSGPRLVAIENGWKLIRPLSFGPAGVGDAGPAAELYSLLDDPRETDDRAASEPERVDRLLAFLQGIPTARPIGATPPPPGFNGPTSPEIEPDNREPVYPSRAEAMRVRPD